MQLFQKPADVVWIETGSGGMDFISELAVSTSSC